MTQCKTHSLVPTVNTLTFAFILKLNMPRDIYCLGKRKRRKLHGEMKRHFCRFSSKWMLHCCCNSAIHGREVLTVFVSIRGKTFCCRSNSGEAPEGNCVRPRQREALLNETPYKSQPRWQVRHFKQMLHFIGQIVHAEASAVVNSTDRQCRARLCRSKGIERNFFPPPNVS